MLLWFCVSGKSCRSVKNACLFFPVFWGFCGVLILVYLGVEGFGVFVVLVFVFLSFRFLSVLLLDCSDVVLVF